MLADPDSTAEPARGTGLVDVPCTVLVVDDDRHSREGLRAALADGGHPVETAADTWEAVRKIRERAFEVAIVDLDLPPVHGVAVSGWDLVRMLRAYSPGIVVIVMGVGDPDGELVLQGEAHRLGVAAFLAKPISLARVGELVRRS